MQLEEAVMILKSTEAAMRHQIARRREFLSRAKASTESDAGQVVLSRITEQSDRLVQVIKGAERKMDGLRQELGAWDL